MAWILNLIQVALFVAAAPLLAGWIKKLKCWSQNRRAPSILQPYRDLSKLLRKETVVAENASWIFHMAPYIIFSVAVLAAAIVPLVAVQLPTARMADVIVLVGFFGLARFFQALAGLDIGTAFGGMGSSREMTIASLAEPAMLMAIFTLAVSMSTTNLSAAIETLLHEPLTIRPSFVFAGLGLALVAIAETGRIPVDNPATHLELTMIHEAMILEYSGHHLALIEWAAQIRMAIYAVLLVNIFLPWGLAVNFTWTALGWGVLAVTGKLILLAVVLVLAETALAKMRLFRAPHFLGFAYLLALLGMLTHVIMEVG
ncbi:MAG: formate hydrogenlyase [Methylothermaceae bacteria B42]|nr:MAG: formate hydrogenlyase [Methylothermaceae bacteria B42]HHJ38391.1 formate hydrogenlyase [Methylothermaceae bacterium]